MAIMTPELPEKVSIENKIQPALSTEMMALDIEVHGTSDGDEIHDDASNKSSLTKNESLIVDSVAPDTLVMNGDSNTEDLQTNKAHLPTPIDTISESLSEPSPFSAPALETLERISTTLDEQSSTAPKTHSPHMETNIPTESVTELQNVDEPRPSLEAAREEHTSEKSLFASPQESIEPIRMRTISPVPKNEEVVEKEIAETIVSNEPSTGINIDPSNGSAEITSSPQELNQPGSHESSSLPVNIKPAEDSLDVEHHDTIMSDISEKSTKVPRGRENDDELEPLAKRTKITEEVTAPKNSSIPPESDKNSSHISREDHSKSSTVMTKITPFQSKELIKILRNISRTNAGKNFRQPVAVLWPSIAENYAAKITNPMDLSTIEKKLKDEAYLTISEVKNDVHLIYNNSVIFNSAENPVTKCAMETRNALFSKFSSIPPEPAPPAKKEKKVVKRPIAAPESTARVPISKKQQKDPTSSPVQNTTQVPAPAFALDPITNTPLIRRESSKGDGGRPKREIHPPKSKDLSYTARPKNRKHLTELKFCEDVLVELQKPKYNSISHPFMVPVDPVALGIPNYFAIIKKPMDVSTVAKKLKDCLYSNASDFEKDIRQIFINCYKYNPDGNPVRQMGKSFEEVFNSFWSKKEQYLLDNSPSAATPSDRDSEEDESEEEEILDPASVNASLMSQKERLLEEQSKLINMMGAKHKDEGLLQMQTDLVELIQKRVKAAEDQARKVMNKKKVTKIAKKPLPVKKPAPIKKPVVKKRYLGTLEKETISAGLGLLPAQIMATVVDMIKTERPELEDAGDETMELDIDSISDNILWQIHALIMKHVPELEAQIRDSMSSEPRQATRTAKPATKKKNKPMSKHEQERKIEALTNLDSEFSRAGFGSLEPTVPQFASSPHQNTNATLGLESSGDEDSDSEEE
ncbi:BgTH12-06646 [Blumeria graminis f. sp. triticale]|uniref:BgTH12-06646 n=1 Tax=Blumeria graminis f. sp. triticale TaxID=1689686 RepID=A0A9W4CY90_BLUGR|nr:BgTH12-06646 [Blumeria graminis f. sp. triticale]